jgi:hypothetical protein
VDAWRASTSSNPAPSKSPCRVMAFMLFHDVPTTVGPVTYEPLPG